MVAGGNVTYTCKGCGDKFIGWLSAKRLYCSNACRQKYKPSGVTHGESYSRLNQIWVDMRRRCRLETDPAYEYYGGRGIRVCKEWDESYVVFRDWALANGYADDLEIDRRNTNGNYEPSNCRWATRSQQMANTRKRRDGITSPFKGVSFNKLSGNWKAQISSAGINSYIGVYRTQLEAALAYDDSAYALRGEYAWLNFPERKRNRNREADVRKAGAGATADGTISERSSLAG